MEGNWWTRRWSELCMEWSRWRRWCGGTSRNTSTSWSRWDTAATRRGWESHSPSTQTQIITVRETRLRAPSVCHQGAAQLAKEVNEKLQEAEEQCRDSLQAEWEECRPCLEEACKTFYTSNCRRGFSTFKAKVWKVQLWTSDSFHKAAENKKSVT